ncbi:MAG: hypothetical protein M3O35_21320 [Acidobacteriota bacterium]|nr:hypothetical protein [Acidobacteriota bacterium]
MKRVLLSWLVCSACVLSADDIPGHYVLRGVMEVGSELLLRPNGTFEYMLAYGASDYEAKGTWRRDQDAVVLNTSGTEAPPFRLLKSLASKTEGIRVWVEAPGGRPVPNIKVDLRTAAGASEQSTDGDGAAIFPQAGPARAVVFRVPVYSLVWGPFDLNPAHNEFHFEVNGEAITQVRFKDERLKIIGKNLEMLFWDKNKPMLYQKQ